MNRAGTIEIAAGDWRATIVPGLGGALAALSRRDHDVLRPLPDDSTSAIDAACIPLVPWGNRIRLGRFRFGGHEVVLPANNPPERHAVHGIGWVRPWILAELVGASAELVLDHAGAAAGEPWPWPFRATQRFELDADGLSHSIELTNTGKETMPAGLGLRPCLRRWRDSRASFSAKEMALADLEQIPTGELVHARHFGDWSKGMTVPAITIDNCYTRWDGTVEVKDGLGTISLQATGAENLHVFAPGTGAELVFAPLNHLPDPFHAEDWSMPMLEPGASARIDLRITEG